MAMANLTKVTPTPVKKTAAANTATVFQTPAKVNQFTTSAAARVAKQAAANTSNAAEKAERQTIKANVETAKKAQINPFKETPKVNQLTAATTARVAKQAAANTSNAAEKAERKTIKTNVQAVKDAESNPFKETANAQKKGSGSGFSLGTAAKAAAGGIVTGMASIAGTGAMVEDVVGGALDKVFQGAGFKGSGIFNTLYNGDTALAKALGLKGIKSESEYYRNMAAENAKKISTGNDTIDNILKKTAMAGQDVAYGVGAAAPMAATAMFSAPAEAAAGLAEVGKNGLIRKGAEVVERSGVLQTLGDQARKLLTSRDYWTAFAQEVGQDYYEALGDGATEDQALTYAVLTSLGNAGIEVGGGIQNTTLPIWKSAIEEGLEEVEQGPVQRLMQNAVYGKGNPFLSVKNENAVINPVTALKEFGMGAAVGGILGAGQRAIGAAANRVADSLAEESQSTVGQVTESREESRAQENPFVRAAQNVANIREPKADSGFAAKRVPTYRELTAKPDVQVVDIRAIGSAKTPPAELRAQILNSPETQALYENPPVNKDTGEMVFVTPATLTHSFSNLGMNNVHATRHLREIIENAVLTHAEPSRKAGDNTTGVYTLFGAVRTENGVQPVKLKVKEYRLRGQDLPNHVKRYFTENGVMNPFSVAYDARVLVMEGIEKEELSSSALTDAANAAVKHPSSSSFISIQDLMRLVNSEYQKYLPKAGDAQQEAGRAAENPFLRAERQRQLDQARDIAKRFGATLEISPLANAEGRYANGVITIDPETENPVRSVLVHELTHHMENGGLYEQFAQKVMDHIGGQRGVNVEGMLAGIKADYAAIGQNLTDEGARRELVAKYAQEHLFTDEATVKRLLAEDRNLFQRIYDWIRDGVTRLTGSPEQQFLIEAQNLYEKALREAGQTVQANPFLQRRDAQYEINPFHRDNIRSWAEDGMPAGETFILGSTGPVLQGLGAVENDLYMDGDKINKILQDHPEMTLEEIKKLPEILEDPVLVLKSRTNPNSIVVFGDYRAQNGRPILAAINLLPIENGFVINDMQKVTSAYTKTDTRNSGADENGRMFLRGSAVLYLDKKRAASVLLPMGIYAPMDILRDGYVGSITYNASGVNISGTPFSSIVRYDQGQQAAGRGFDELARDAQSEEYLDALAREENIPGVERYTAEDAARDAQMQRLLREGAPNPFIGRRAYDVESEQAEVKPDAVQDLEPVLKRENMPTKAYEHLQKAENRLTRKIVEAMSVPAWAGREQIKPIVQAATEEYLNNGRVSDATRRRIFEEAWQQGVLVDDTLWRESADVRRVLRQEGVTLSDADRADVGDYDALRKRAFGRVRVLNEGGAPVDVAYERLKDMDAALFPADITHPADQLQRMVDVAEGLGKVERHLTALYGEEADFYRASAENDFEAAIRDMEATLYDVRRYSLDRLAHDSVKLESPDMVKTAYSQIKQLRRAKEKAVANNLLTEVDKMKVGRLLRGEIQPEMLDPRTDNVKGILEVYAASEEYEYMAKVIRDYNKARKAKLLEEADRYLQNANSWKDKRSGIAYQRETMERNIRDITGRGADGDALVDAYIKPVHANEAEATRFKNKLRDRIRGLKLSRDVAKGNEVSEAYAVQLIGEAENAMAMLKDAERGAKREGKTYEDWRALIDDLWMNNPNLDEVKVRGAVEEFRDIYDDLFRRLNEVHLRNGYEPISYRSGYFPHFQQNEPDGVLAAFGKAFGAQWEVTPLPTSINGLTGMFKPGKKWMGEAMERRGYDTVYDAVEGFDRYMETAADVIYHTDDIQRLRALAQQIRYRTTDEGIQKQIDDVRADNTLTEIQKQDELNRIYENGRFTLNNFVLNLEEYTNLLAGKKSKHDRQMEERFGDRRWYNVIQALESRVSANMVGVNPGSWLTNFIPIAQAWGAIDTKNMLRAMGRTLGSTVGGNYSDGLAESSDFLTNRRGSERLAQTKMQKVSAAAGKGMEIIDDFTSEVIVRARYLQNIQRGMSEKAALEDADAFAASVMADRSKGAMPTLFHEKNPMTKLLTQYQLEVNNQLSYLFKDMPADLKERGMAALATALLKFFVGSWLYNELYEKLVGRRPALDPIGMLNDFSGDLTGWELPNLVDLATGKDRSFQTEKKGAYGAVENLAKNAAEELPFVGGLLGGGRIPISSALPNVKNVAKAALNEDWSPEKKRATIAKELSAPAAYLVPPFGGGQLKKIYQGLKTVAENGSYSVDAEGNKLLQFPVYNDSTAQTVGNYAQAAVFGKTALPAAQEWIDSGFKTYSAKETAAYQGMLEAGVSGKDAIELLKKLRTAEKTEDQSAADVKRTYLRESKVNGEGRSVVYYGMLAGDKEQALMDELADRADAGALTDALIDIKNAEKDDEKLQAIQNSRLTEEQKAATYMQLLGSDDEPDKVKMLGEICGLTPVQYYRYVCATKGLTKRDEKLAALDQLNLSVEQKNALYYMMGYKESTINNTPWYNPNFEVEEKEESTDDRPGWLKNLEAQYGAGSSDEGEQKKAASSTGGSRKTTGQRTKTASVAVRAAAPAGYNPFLANRPAGAMSAAGGGTYNPFLAAIQRQRQQQGSDSTPQVGVSSGGGNPFLRAATPSGGNPFLRRP